MSNSLTDNNRGTEKSLYSHTPGPWTAFYKAKYDEWHVSVPAYGPSAMKLALFPDGIPTKNQADAHLIAAAPDLLEALVRALHVYVGLANSGDCGNWNPEEETFVIFARAAINKARGC